MLLQFSSDGAASRLRRLLGTIEREAMALSAHADRQEDRLSAHHLREALTQAIELLALGPEPEVRDCPICGRVVRQAATRCGYCWASILPMPRTLPPGSERDSEAVWKDDGGRRL